MRITSSVTEQVVKYSPDCIIIAVTNPLDAMVQNVYETSGFPRNRVFGMAGILDTARFRTFIAEELNVSVEDVQALVLGGHGDDMVPLVRYTSVGGIPITELMAEEKIDQLVARTRAGGGEIVALLKEGSAYYAPSAAITQMVEAVLLDKKRVLPACAYLEGEYGINGLCVGVPVKLGAGGVEQIMQIGLTEEERTALRHSAASVQELVDVMQKSKEEAAGYPVLTKGLGSMAITRHISVKEAVDARTLAPGTGTAGQSGQILAGWIHRQLDGAGRPQFPGPKRARLPHIRRQRQRVR